MIALYLIFWCDLILNSILFSLVVKAHVILFHVQPSTPLFFIAFGISSRLLKVIYFDKEKNSGKLALGHFGSLGSSFSYIRWHRDRRLTPQGICCGCQKTLETSTMMMDQVVKIRSRLMTKMLLCFSIATLAIADRWKKTF